MARPKEFDREQALDKAQAVFWKNGYGSSSTEDLRLAMGIGRQSFYDTFKDKRALYIEVVRKYNSDVMANYLELLRKADSPLDAIRELLVSVAVANSKQRGMGCLAVASVCEFGTEDAELTSVQASSASALHMMLEKILLEAKAKKKVRGGLDVKAAARFLRSTLVGMKVTARGGASEKTLQDIAEVAVEGLAIR
jgi:AcrR family transcriptional regulator